MLKKKKVNKKEIEKNSSNINDLQYSINSSSKEVIQ